MATTVPYLEITDATTSVKIMDSSATTPALVAAMNYRLSYGGWSPKIAQRNKSPFGLPYLAVVEEMTIDIKGSTPDQVLNKLQTLNALLDQGERWYNNEIVAPVFLRYQLKGSALSTYLKDTIIGGYANGQSAEMVTVPNDFNVLGEIYFLKGVQLKFWRRIGTWLGESESQSLSNQSQRSIMQHTWTSAAPTLSPLDLKIYVDTAPGSSPQSGFVIVTHDETYLSFVNGETLGGAATADAANNSVGGNVGRFTCSTTQQEGFKELFTENFYQCEYVAVYATVRNNSATDDVYLQANVNFTNYPILAPEIKIDKSASPVPQAVFLGVFPTGGRQPFHVGIYYRSLAGTPTVDVDQMLVVGINRATNIIALPSFKINNSAALSLNILTRILLEPQPEICYLVPALGTFEERLTWSGSAFCFHGGHATKTKTALVVFATQGAKWQITTAANAACLVNTTLTRYKAYLVPE